MWHCDLPHPGQGEVLVGVACCALCGSDLHTYSGRRSGPAPTVLGHEIVGRILELGPSAPQTDVNGSPLRVGDRVTWSIVVSCGRCFFCERGLPQKCERLFKYGHEQATPGNVLHGGLADHCLLRPNTVLVRLPDDLPDAVACPLSCATATVAAVLRASGGCRDEVVLVQGAGMLGLTACAMARAAGARAVICWDSDAGRLTLAEQFGATALAGADREPLADVVARLTERRGVDVALELTGAVEALETGLPLVRIGGRYTWAGAVAPTRPVAVLPEMVVRRMLQIRGVHNYAPADLQAALSFLEQNARRFPFAGLTAATFELAEAEAAFRHGLERRPVRVVVVPQDLGRA
jgi:alcohol dehydrogenase